MSEVCSSARKAHLALAHEVIEQDVISDRRGAITPVHIESTKFGLQINTEPLQ